MAIFWMQALNDPHSISIASVSWPDAALIAFLQDARSAMFADRVDARVLPADLRDFERSYAGAAGHMLAARHGAAGVVGSIGFRAYDHRFAQLDYAGLAVVEVVRLFVHPAWRRTGLGGRLFDALHAQALRQGVELLYLHTHPFLPGAVAFWQQRHFRVTQREADPLWQTIHMERRLAPV